MKYHEALRIAEALLAEMKPFCHRIAIAGSIRRGKQDVKDIEIVAVPRWEDCPDPANLFGEAVPTNRLYGWGIAPERNILWIKPGTSDVVPWPIKPGGKYWRGLVCQSIKLDIFLTKPENYGAQFLIRTGSADFSHAVAAHAQRICRPFADGFLTVGGVPVETPDEADVFRLLGLEYIEPARRIDARSLRRVEAR